MAVNQKSVKEKLDQWAVLQEKICKSNVKRNRELDPHLRAHQEAIAPIVEKYDQAVAPFVVESNALEKEIESLLFANVDSGGKPKTMTVQGATATAQVSKHEGARVVDVQKFFEAVKVKTESFWNSLKVVIKDAEQLVGKTKIDEISEKRTWYAVAIELKK